tara:strand:+ start:122 stop:556 length:435 start_codon:yes stop_codon:yes gene_type:complete
MNYLKIILKNFNNTDVGLLIMRITFGCLMYYNHGHAKLFGGVDRWYGLGGALTNLIGLESLRTFFGLMASLSESVFALLIVAGLLTRISSSLLGFTMFIATLRHVLDGDLPEMAILYLIFCVLMLVAGPGKYSADSLYLKKFTS